MWKQAVWYGLLLAMGTLALQWMDYQRMARAHTGDIYAILVAIAFLALGVFVGTRLTRVPKATAFDGNPKAQAALGISPREMEVLQHMAAGHSYKEIAQTLDVSPNTVKTHVARLFDKLEAKRRTDAINKARQLGILA
jgi:DNA-binding CsgD family transcriptional regulator